MLLPRRGLFLLTASAESSPLLLDVSLLPDAFSEGAVFSLAAGFGVCPDRERADDETEADDVDASLLISLDGVDERESASFDGPPSTFLVAFVDELFLDDLAELWCNFETSFCFCTLASLYFKTRFSGTHSSQLQEKSND